MIRSLLLFVPISLLVGCLSEDENTALVASSPFGRSEPGTTTRTRTSFSEATIETASRVDTLGRKILAANPQIGLRPMFSAIGAPGAEIFHIQTARLVITEGLVKQCKTEGELAALLCHELGKMVSEREALVGPAARSPERLPPMDVPVGNDNAGLFGPPDETHRAELAKYGQDRRRSKTAPLLPPNPKVLARTYLTKAGFAERDLEAVAPLLQEADKNTAWEKQMVPAAPARPWTN